MAYRDAQKTGDQLIIRMFDKNISLSDTTVYNLVPSITPDEISAVVPRGPELVKKLTVKFNQPGGIKVVDVDGVFDTPVANHFISQVERYSADEIGHSARSKVLLELGKLSMDMWQDLYATADYQLKEIFRAANFNPCCELTPEHAHSLHHGYRIDLIYNVENARQKAQGMINDYQALGYQQCRLLTPDEVMKMDPFLEDFCIQHAQNNTWNSDAVALWRPGGCLDAQVFLPRLYEYLSDVMGSYQDEYGNECSCFEIHTGKKVTAVLFEQQGDEPRVVGLVCEDGTTIYNDRAEYVFCPGEAVGTLKSLGFNEPAYAGFAGVSLLLSIDIPQEKIDRYKLFNHCMEVHQEGVVLAWQARYKEGKIFIGVAGTKAFYADQRPTTDQEFAQDRNLLQLNMINDVLPEFISDAFGYDTKGKTLTHKELYWLQSHGIAKRWAGVRSVVYDGFPTLGHLYKDGIKVVNARCTTHLGSGGVSFAPGVTKNSREANNPQDAFTRQILTYSSSIRTA